MKAMKTLLWILAAGIIGGAIYLSLTPSVLSIEGPGGEPIKTSAATLPSILPEVPPSAALDNPPAIHQGIYFTGWSGGKSSRVDGFLTTAADKKLNVLVVDVKDYSGYVSYAMDVSAVRAAGADREIRIADFDALVRKLHAQNIYVIARVTVFQDPIFAAAHPELALAKKNADGLWWDKKGLAWLDPAGEKTWQYAADIAKDALSRGVDEVNFDYIRFPSDGDLDNASYPFWDGLTPRHEVLRRFFAYLRAELPAAKISADLFGLTVSEKSDMGIGQILEDAYPYFDYISPMVYPSHFAAGTYGYQNPAANPYEIVKRSMEEALARRADPEWARIRPWLQAFDLGAKYTPQMVGDQIRATEEVLAGSPDAYGGWLLWDPANNYASYVP